MGMQQRKKKTETRPAMLRVWARTASVCRRRCSGMLSGAQ